MKKSIILFLLLAIIPNIAFSQNTLHTTLVSEDISILDSIYAENPSFSLKEESAVTLTELEKAIEHKQVFMEDLGDTSSSPPIIVSREFAVYYTLQSMGIHLSPEDIDSINESFDDVHSDSFFAPYIFFAKKTGMITGYEDGDFRPKHFLSQKELKTIIHDTFEKNFEKIQQEYSLLTKWNEDITLYSAPEENSTTWNLSDLLQRVQKIELFDGETLYIQNEYSETIYGSMDDNETLFFQKISNPNEYTLYFDYNGIPFLAKNLQKFSHSLISQIMIDSINAYRHTHGLLPLKHNHKLDAVAQEYAQTLFESRHFEHKDEGGKRVGDRVLEKKYDYMYAAENLAKGQTTIEGAMNDWQNSPSHNKNLLNPNIEDVGIGFYGNYWVQVFAKELSHSQEK